MSRVQITLPSAGGLEFTPGFVSTELVNRANAYTSPEGQEGFGGFWLEEKAPSDVAFMIATVAFGERPEPLADMTEVITESVSFPWKSVSLYVRHMGVYAQTRSLGIHVDNDASMRVLVEGHGSTWQFDQVEETKKYPGGLPLNPGDVVVLNNYCPYKEQLRHGVEMMPGQSHRTSYLFNFYK